MSSPGGAAAKSPDVARSRRAPSWPRVAVVGGVFVLALFVSRSCQESEIKLTQEDAVAKATQQVDFAPEDTQVRLLRQGIQRHPFWIISLSTLNPDGATYQELAVVRIDATSGEIVEFREQKGKETRAP